ncbi:MAG: GntR family transcriptional regulator [Halanaerobiaceae bacterium]
MNNSDDIYIPDELQDLQAKLYKNIKKMIYEKELKPGEKIKQEKLSKRLGVSRTPLIKILQRLSTEKLVEYKPRRGFYVKKLTLEEMIEFFEIREVVEGVAAKKVARNASDSEIEKLSRYYASFGEEWSEKIKKEYRKADQAFHSKMIELGDNQLLIEINQMFNIYRISYQKGLMRSPEETLPEHKKLIKALKNRDEYKAQKLAMEHIDKSIKNIAEIFSEEVEINGEGEIIW